MQSRGTDSSEENPVCFLKTIPPVAKFPVLAWILLSVIYLQWKTGYFASLMASAC